MKAVLQSLLNCGAAVVVGMALFGCASMGTEGMPGTVGTALRRVDDISPIPRDARIGLAEFRKCGASYLDRLNPDYYEQDRKALFYLTCTEFGYPAMFNEGFRQRLDQLLRKKLVRVKSDKPFMAKVVLKDAEKAGADYVLAGDLLAMGETADEAVVSAQLFIVRVADRKIVLQGRARKVGPKGNMENVINAVADELFQAAFVD